MAVTWKPWITPVYEILDTINEIPNVAVKEY